MKLPSGLPIGYTAALSTFSHIRGIDASDVSLFFLDEFIKEPHEAGGFLAGAFSTHTKQLPGIASWRARPRYSLSARRTPITY